MNIKEYREIIYCISLAKCHTLGNFNLTENGKLREFTSIEKEPLSDDLCKTDLKGYTRNHFRNFICTNFRAEEKVWNTDIFYVVTVRN